MSLRLPAVSSYRRVSLPVDGAALENEDLIPLSEAAAISGLTRQHVAFLARSGKLRAQRIGRFWVTSRAAVEEYLGDAHERSKDPLKNKR